MNANPDILTGGTKAVEVRLAAVEERQVAIETKLEQVIELLSDRRSAKTWYTPVELAEILGKRPYTVREWCRLGRINARKRPTGRGDAEEWEVSHEELDRYRNHGLLAIPTKY
jgi:hypothetical protein